MACLVEEVAGGQTSTTAASTMAVSTMAAAHEDGGITDLHCGGAFALTRY